MKYYRFAATSLLLSFSLAIAGCGGTAPVETTEVAKAQPGLNGGMAYPIPGDLGYVEVVVERTKPGQPVIVAAYFLDATAKNALAADPSAVRARLVLPVEDAPKEVALTAKAKSGGKSTGKRFATEPGNFDFDELKGELLVTLDGKEVSVPFAFR
ncbi:hypothetical protein GC170_16880 [bacterium]|nr:hypothetical protein [bacterium]